MPRDLFSSSLADSSTPARSKWTILGSLIAHVIALGALLVLPVLSALDNYVLQARTVSFVIPASPVLPAIPPPPPKAATAAVPSDINPDAAPSTASSNPVEVDRRLFTVVPYGSDVPIGAVGVPGGTGDPSKAPILEPPPPPRRPDPVRVGGAVSPPTRLSYAAPAYPHIAVVSKTEGSVILEATIDEAGVVRDVKVLRSIPLLDQAAIEAVRKWRYTPTRLNGAPVPVLMTVTVTFQLR